MGFFIQLGRYRMTMAEAIELLGVTPLMLLISGLVLAVVGIVVTIFLGLWTYHDAKERSHEPALWTLLVLFVPLPIGIILYLVVGRNKEGQSTGRYLKPLIATAILFVVNLLVLIGYAIHLVVLMAQHGLV